MGLRTAKKLIESIRLTLRDLEKNTKLHEDSRSDLQRIPLLRLADLESATVDEPGLSKPVSQHLAAELAAAAALEQRSDKPANNKQLWPNRIDEPVPSSTVNVRNRH